MNIRRAHLYWGAFLIAIGAVLVAADLGGVDDGSLGQLLRLWPLAIVALGIGLVLRATRISLAGGLVAAVVPGLVLGGAIVAVPRVIGHCEVGTPATTTVQQGTFTGPASVELTMRCGRVDVSTTQGTGWQLVAGRTDGPMARVDATGQHLAVETGRSGWPDTGRGVADWRLALPTTRLDRLSLETNAGATTVDLGGAQVGELTLSVNAGDSRLDLDQATIERIGARLNAGSLSVRLPAASDVTGMFDVDLGALKLCAPPGIGLRIHGSTTLAGADYSGLVRNGDTWESPDYATAAHHAELTVTVNLGSVNLDPRGGCQ